MKTFRGRVAAITGAGSGIGEALALALAAEGSHLALADIHAESLERVAAQVANRGIQCSTHRVDVSDRAQVEQFAADTHAAHGAVHLLFNNAGVALTDYIDSQSYDDFEWLMSINFWGVVYGTRSFLPLLRKVDEARITNISSLFGLGSLPSQGAYNASKFAVRGFTEALKMELSRDRIGVSCVHPGGIRTNIARNGRIAEESVRMSRDGLVNRFERLARTSPEKAARIILTGVRKNRRRILVGADARLADLIIRLFPGSYEKILRLEKPLHERWPES